MAFSPLIKTPLTDFDAICFPSGRIKGEKFCTNIQMKLSDCIDAYGLAKGKYKCAELFYDAIECSRGTVQRARSQEIQKERLRQYQEGKISKPFGDNPPLDAFLPM